MGYLQDVDQWLDALLTDVSDGKIGVPELKRAIREKVLESYRNGLKAPRQDAAPEKAGASRRRFPRQ
jgi:hypothetical protein